MINAIHSLRRAIRGSAMMNQGLRFVLPKYRQLAVNRGTQIVIEGYPRCANTFAVVAFEMSQPSPVSIAHHLHSIAQIRLGVKYGIPTLVLIREPKDAILSLAIRKKHSTPAWATDEYIDFHSQLMLLRDDVVLAGFTEVTNEYGAVIRRLNARFGVNFAEFQHTEENIAACYEQIDLIEKNEHGGQAVRSTHVARPASGRSERKGELAAMLNSPRLASRLQEAERLHQELSPRGASSN